MCTRRSLFNCRVKVGEKRNQIRNLAKIKLSLKLCQLIFLSFLHYFLLSRHLLFTPLPFVAVLWFLIYSLYFSAL